MTKNRKVLEAADRFVKAVANFTTMLDAGCFSYPRYNRMKIAALNYAAIRGTRKAHQPSASILKAAAEIKFDLTRTNGTIN